MTNASEGPQSPPVEPDELPLTLSSTEQSKAEKPRFCGYSQCDKELPKSGGRPFVYCPDRRWADGKTCKQMAAAEREAVQAAAMDVPLNRFREDSTQLVPHLEALGAKLAEVQASVQGVDAGALARIAEEEQIATTAVERANEAEAERDKALNRANKEAAEAKQARADKVVAERRMRDAERESKEQIGAAWSKSMEHEVARSAAETKAAEAGLNTAAQIERYKQLDRRFEDQAKANKELTKANGAAEAARKAAEAERAKAEARAKEATDAAAKAAKAATKAETEAAADRAELEKLRTRLTEVEGLATQQGTDLTAARADLASQRERAARAEAAAATEKERANGLVAELATAEQLAEQQGEEVTRLTNELRAEQERAARAEAAAATEKERADSLVAELATAEQFAEQQGEEVTRLTNELAAAKASAATVDQLRELIQAKS